MVLETVNIRTIADSASHVSTNAVTRVFWLTVFAVREYSKLHFVNTNWRSFHSWAK